MESVWPVWAENPPNGYNFKVTGLRDRSDRSNTDRTTASFMRRGIYAPWLHPFVGADARTFQNILRALWALGESSPTSLCESCLIQVESLSWVKWIQSLRVIWAREFEPLLLSTWDYIGQLDWAFVTLGASAPKLLGVAGLLPRLWWAATSLSQ